MIITCDCGLFMYFCEINKFLQSFLTNLCLGFKCSKFTTSCVNVSSGPWANALSVYDYGMRRSRPASYDVAGTYGFDFHSVETKTTLFWLNSDARQHFH